MKKPLLLALCLMMPLSALAADDIYLEGVSVLGVKKTAHVVINDVKLMVKEQDYVGEWEVVKITDQLVTLRNDAGEVSTLALHSRLSPVAEPAPAETAPAAEKTDDEAFKEVTDISDETVPEGYRKVRTPFGELLVRKKEALGEAEPPMPAVKSSNFFDFSKRAEQQAQSGNAAPAAMPPANLPSLFRPKAAQENTQKATESTAPAATE